MRPEVDQTILRMTIGLLEALAPAIIERLADQLERQSRPPVLMTYRKPLDLGELAEEANAHASGRFMADEAEEVRGDEIVAVELFLHRAILLGEIDGRADRGHQHEVVRIARDAN